jgi:hypothetical protein
MFPGKEKMRKKSARGNFQLRPRSPALESLSSLISQAISRGEKHFVWLPGSKRE